MGGRTLIMRRLLRRRRFLLLAGLCNYGLYHWIWGRTSSDQGVSGHRWERPLPVGHRIRTMECTVPQFDSLDPSVKPYVRHDLKSMCQGKPNFLSIR
ncbi:hypothetical protein HPB52_005666 [Rhipicephalus sanguineus]|uniref:Uncharacterized protein n=1 Tax=Rhipicephalus sanguineus TaxID=34632 RepID=A0A9D4STQ9_RHISA|nr:hypothetical protein HPB52_005666 [Rhipicephalus sanguineus]